MGAQVGRDSTAIAKDIHSEVGGGDGIKGIVVLCLQASIRRLGLRTHSADWAANCRPLLVGVEVLFGVAGLEPARARDSLSSRPMYCECALAVVVANIAALLAGEVDTNVAELVGEVIRVIHPATVGRRHSGRRRGHKDSFRATRAGEPNEAFARAALQGLTTPMAAAVDS